MSDGAAMIDSRGWAPGFQLSMVSRLSRKHNLDAGLLKTLLGGKGRESMAHMSEGSEKPRLSPAQTIIGIVFLILAVLFAVTHPHNFISELIRVILAP